MTCEWANDRPTKIVKFVHDSEDDFYDFDFENGTEFSTQVEFKKILSNIIFHLLLINLVREEGLNY